MAAKPILNTYEQHMVEYYSVLNVVNPPPRKMTEFQAFCQVYCIYDVPDFIALVLRLDVELEECLKSKQS